MTRLPLLSRRATLLGVGALIVAKAADARVGIPEGAEPSPVQRRFGEVIERYSNLARSETQPARRDALLIERGRELRDVLGGTLAFSRWIVARSTLSRASGDGVIVSFMFFANPPGNVVASMWNMDLSGKALSPPISATSPLAPIVTELPDRGVAMVSGSFFSDDRRGLSDGMPMSPKSDAGQFDTPSFLARFDTVEQPAWLEDLSSRTPRR
jgi:hypothetical protein